MEAYYVSVGNWDAVRIVREKMNQLGYAWRDNICYPPGTMPGVTAHPDYVDTNIKRNVQPTQTWETGAVGSPGSCMYQFMLSAYNQGMTYDEAINAYGQSPAGTCTYNPVLQPVYTPSTGRTIGGPTPTPSPTPTPTPTPVPTPVVMQALQKGMYLDVPPNVPTGSTQTIRVLVINPKDPAIPAEAHVVLLQDNKQVAEGDTSQSIVAFLVTIDSDPRSRYTKFCARSDLTYLGGVAVSGSGTEYEAYDCRTVGYVSPTVDISTSLALQAQEIGLIQQYLGLAASGPSTPTYPLPALPSIPTIPGFPSIPTTPVTPSVPSIVPQLGTIQIPKIPKPLGFLQYPVSIYVDGVYAGSPPLSYQVAPGTHTVSLKLQGLQDITGTYDVPAGQTITLSGQSFA
jgi:hypothetical protein